MPSSAQSQEMRRAKLFKLLLDGRHVSLGLSTLLRSLAPAAARASGQRTCGGWSGRAGGRVARRRCLVRPWLAADKEKQTEVPWRAPQETDDDAPPPILTEQKLDRLGGTADTRVSTPGAAKIGALRSAGFQPASPAAPAVPPGTCQLSLPLRPNPLPILQPGHLGITHGVAHHAGFILFIADEMVVILTLPERSR